jgi:hypothetical protein
MAGQQEPNSRAAARIHEPHDLAARQSEDVLDSSISDRFR